MAHDPGTPAFFGCTKKLHNTLQGEAIEFSETEKAIYEQVVFENATRLHIEDCDAVIVHDPQPLPLVRYFEDRRALDMAMPHRPDRSRSSGMELSASFR